MPRWARGPSSHERGFTLIELMIVLVVFVVLVGGIYGLYAVVSAGGRTDAAAKAALALVSATGRVYTDVPPNYEGISAASVYRQAPKSLRGGAVGSLVDPWGGALALRSVSPFVQYQIEFPTVPAGDCAPFVAAVKNSFTAIAVGGATVYAAGSTSTRADLEAACAGAEQVVVTLTRGGG